MVDNNCLLRKKWNDSGGNWALAAIKQALARLLVRQIISGLFFCICVVVSTYTILFVAREFWTFYGSENKIYVLWRGRLNAASVCIGAPVNNSRRWKKKGWEWNIGKDETPPCMGCMRLLVSRYIVCRFVVIPRWQHSAVCSVWSWVCVWMWVRLCDSSLSYHLQSGACWSSPMGTPLLIGHRDQCSWMFIWVYICIMVRSFLVSVFSSLLFLCFFFW